MSYFIPNGATTVGATQIREVRVSYRGRRRTMPCSLSRPDQVAAFVRKLISNDAREHFVVIHLDGRHRPIAYQVVSVGTATASLVHPREVFQAAVAIGAGAILVVHNHPSGDPSPSAEDRSVTDRLIKAGQVLGIPLLDSLVVADHGYASIRELEPQKFTKPKEEPR